MEASNSSAKALISGLINDSRQEADEIIQDAERQAEERRKYASKQVERILKEAEEKVLVQLDATRRSILSGVDTEVRRKTMQIREKILGEIITQVKEEFKRMVGSERYVNVLNGWIVEAMIGLGVERAEVNATAEEKKLINALLLSGVEKKIGEITGNRVSIEISKDPALSSQGVVLTSADGRTAFNNQVATRLLRKQRAIRSLIYERLFHEQ